MDKNKLLEFIKKNKLAVISSVNEKGSPESAVLEYGESDDFEIIIDMYDSSRKYKNMKKIPNVSLVIGWDENITVQYEGVAEELTSEEKTKYQELYWAKNPEAKRWAEREGIVYFKVSPRWIRYSDLNTHPWDISEFTF